MVDKTANFSASVLTTDLNVAMRRLNGMDYTLSIMVDALGNDLILSGPSQISGRYDALLLSTGLAAASGTGEVPVVVGPHGQMITSFMSSSGRLVKSHRFDLLASPTTVDFNDNVPMLGAMGFEYDLKATKIRPARVLAHSKTFEALGGADTGHIVSAVPCQAGRLSFVSKRTSDFFVKVYDKATAASASDTPVLLRNVSPGNFEWNFDRYMFQNGISMRFTTGVAQADTAFIAASEVLAFSMTLAL